MGFSFGPQPSGDSSSPGFDSIDVTPDDADIESGGDDDDIEVLEHVPIDMSENMDDVQVIQLDSAEQEEATRETQNTTQEARQDAA